MHGDAAVIRHQLTALANVGEQVVIHVLPPGRAAPSSGQATILPFAAPPGLGTVYVPALSGGRADLCGVSSAHSRDGCGDERILTMDDHDYGEVRALRSIGGKRPRKRGA